MSTILSVAGETEPEGRAEASEEEAERAAARQAGLVAARRLSAARFAGGQATPLPPAEHATSPPTGHVASAELPAPTEAGSAAGSVTAAEPSEPLGSVGAIEKELSEVEAALDRIDDGLVLLDAEDYGTCVICQAEIPVAELAADPYLRACSSHRPAPGRE